jgi:hypothetical protein
MNESMWSDLESNLKRFTSVYGESPEARRPKNAEVELTRTRYDLDLWEWEGGISLYFLNKISLGIL